MVLVEKTIRHDDIPGEVNETCGTVNLLELEYGKKGVLKIKN